ncbi:carbohydrate ABC transporter permease [Aeromicrobium sp.]|uniref:carbohydrate ABC transporter permease n=1 Tax=Aeromicrobium sp. TaxID=1871063 RepID=UPI002FC718EF
MVIPNTLRRRPKSGRLLPAAGEFLFVLPVLALLAVTVVLPTLQVLFHAFTDWQPGYHSEWVGFDNFAERFSSDSFWQVLRNQAFLLLGLPIWILTPLALAFLLHEGVPRAGLYRAIYFFPAIAPPSLIGILFAMLLQPQGLINSVLRSVGLGGLAQDWLTSEQLVKPVLIVVLAWATVGTGVVIFSAALSAVPTDQFEAARLDGASWRQRLWHVALPSIRGTVELWSVILVVIVFTGIFPWIYTLTRGGPGYSSSTLDWDIYQNSLQFGYYGTAAAEVVIMLALVVVVVVLGALLTRRSRR